MTPSFWLRVARWIAPADRRDEIEGDLTELWALRAADGRRGLHLALIADLFSLVASRIRAARESRARISVIGVLDMRQDLRFALKLIRRQQAFALLVVATLALGIGPATAIFTICDRVLLRPLPYPEPQQLVRLMNAPFSFQGGHMRVSSAVSNIKAIAAVGMYASGGANFGDSLGAARVRAAVASSSFFNVMGVSPAIGRVYNADEDRAMARLAVVSHGLWSGRLAGRADIPGLTVALDGQPFTIVGVMPEGFDFPNQTDVWIPPDSDWQVTGQAFAPELVARLAPGLSLAQGQAALDAFEAAAKARESRLESDPMIVRPLQEDLTSSIRATLIFLASGVTLLLLATCSNVAGLFMSRLLIRTRELSLRMVLGAPRWRLVRQVVIEVAVLSMLGAVLGVALAYAMLQSFVALPIPISAASSIGSIAGIDGRMALVGFAVAAFAATVFGVGPAWLAGARRGRDLGGGSRTTTISGRWWRRGLVAAQVSLALILLSGAAGSLVATWQLSRVDLGFGRPNAMTAEITLPESRYGDVGRFAAFFERLDTSLRTVPGVSRVGATSFMPGTSQIGVGLLLHLFGATAPGDVKVRATMVSVSPEYFAAMGMTMRRGRAFTSADRQGAPGAIILSESAAAQLFPGVADPPTSFAIGKHAELGLRSTKNQPLEIVGVVNDVHFRGPASPTGPAVYVPVLQRPPNGPMSIVIDSDGSQPVSIDAARRAINTVDADLPVYHVMPLDELRRSFLARERLSLVLSASFAIATLALVLIGLYGVMSQLVAQRTREIGITMALGADPNRVRQDIIRGAEWVVAAGSAVGLAAVVWIGQATQGLVPGYTPPGAPMITALVALLIFVGLIAAWLPARRAAAVDPVVALRAE